MEDYLSDWNHWHNIDPKNFPIILFGGNNAGHNDEFDTRNKFVKLIACYGMPPIFKIESLDGKSQIDGCLPLRYRLATPKEIELIRKQESEYFTEKDFTVILNKAELEVGMRVTIDGCKGKIISLNGNMGDNYCLVELDEPNRFGWRIIETLKSDFNYLTYPE